MVIYDVCDEICTAMYRKHMKKILEMKKKGQVEYHEMLNICEQIRIAC